MKYPTYYNIPWPDGQELMTIDSALLDELVNDGVVIFHDPHNTLVEKEWFDKNRQNYGL